MPAVNIRLFNTTGPGKTDDAPSDLCGSSRRIKKGLQKPLIEVGNLKPQRAFLDVNDTVRGFYLAALKGKRGEAYNLCATKTHEIGELLRTAIRLSGVKAEVREVDRLMRPSDEKIIFGGTRKIRRDTGWKPQQTLRRNLDCHAATLGKSACRIGVEGLMVSQGNPLSIPSPTTMMRDTKAILLVGGLGTRCGLRCRYCQRQWHR